ncbi:choline ABC transporter permease subunit [Candidatus Persebacteraceae bacterium Df01]|jgi:glycine betaine/proline transport system permease protein|uniref:Choline ABC transporter permease subunit n=1 Tax=Candidatus Doriopsillibacter californiensis TaxID=2970740 RepID=A0ABT7QK95_9GAMM|nr:choline ABC transporter permease subunit [Candidatus Persebacteraceae bacterium Df01]
MAEENTARWLTDYKLPLGDGAKAGVNWLTDNAGTLFDSLAVALEHGIDALLWLLQTPSPLALITLLAILVHLLHRRWLLTLFVVAGMLLIVNQGYWKETTQTLALVLASAFICMAVGVPLGVAAARRPWLYAILRPILDFMQTIPTFVYLIPALILFGLGPVPGLIATVIFAMPAPIRMTHLGVSSTPKILLEVGDAFGCSPWERLVKIEFPHALPQMLAGLTQAIMLSLSMVVIAALVGAGGLGVPILRALNQVNIGKGFESGIIIVIIAIILDRACRLRQPRRNN